MNDDFEKRLQRQPHRELPSAWREEILIKARASTSPAQPKHAPQPRLSRLIQTLFDSPPRLAWTGLAAAWAVIVTLNLATGETSKTTSMTGVTAPATPQTLRALKQQRMLYAELVGRPEQPPTERFKITTPGPRSQRREEMATV